MSRKVPLDLNKFEDLKVLLAILVFKTLDVIKP